MPCTTPARFPALRIAAWLLLLAFGTQACSTDPIQGHIVTTDAGNDTKKAFGNGSLDSSLGGDAKAGSPDASSATDVVTKREIIVLLNTDLPQVMAPNGLLPIAAKIVDYALGSPASDVEINWEVVENQGMNGPGLGNVDIPFTITDGKGLTSNVFRANKSPSVSYKIKVSCEGAEDVFIDIGVTDTPKGTIRVTMVYDNQVVLGQVDVRIMPVPFTCASFKPVSPPGTFIGSKTTLLEDKPEFQNLAADKKYGVYVIGKDPDNHLTAAGCADAILVLDKQTTDVTVTVQTLALLASGPYDMVNHFDFTGAIPGNLGKILDTAVQIFYDPGAFIIAQVKNL